MEDLTDIADSTTITAIDDWDKRFRLANYTEEQRRIVHLANENMRTWMEYNEKTDWTEQLNENGLTVFCRNSDRKLNTMKASKILPYRAIDVFSTLNAGYLRQTYDENIKETKCVKRLCANVKVLYQ